MQVSEARFIEKIRADYRRVICLKRPRTTRVSTRNALRICATHGVLRIVVEKSIDVEAKHQRLPGGQLMVQPAVEKERAIVSGNIEVSIGGQQESRERRRQEGRSILPRVVSRGKEESLVFDDWTTERSGHLLQRVRNVYRVDRLKRRRHDARGNRARAKTFGRKSLGLPIARANQKHAFAMKRVGAGFGDDVQRRTGSPAKLRRESVRQHVDFLNRAERHGRNRRLAAPTFVVVGAVKREGGGAARTYAGDEVSSVDKKISGAFSLPECGVEKRQRGRLAAEYRRLVNCRTVEPHANRYIRAHAFAGAEDCDLGFFRADAQCHLHRRGLA